MNTKEPPSQPPIATRGQPQDKQAQDASTKVDSTVIVTSTTKEQDKQKSRKKDTTDSTTQSQGAPHLITVIDQGRSEQEKEEEKTPKEKEKEAIQMLVNFPTIGTPTK